MTPNDVRPKGSRHTDWMPLFGILSIAGGVAISAFDVWLIRFYTPDGDFELINLLACLSPLGVGTVALGSLVLATFGAVKSRQGKSRPGCLLSAAGAVLTVTAFMVCLLRWLTNTGYLN